jgi:DHA2 family multidrug resistance protein
MAEPNERTASPDAATSLTSPVWRPSFNPWLIGVVVAIAAFMEVLDTSIANVALPYIAGNLGASNDPPEGWGWC